MSIFEVLFFITLLVYTAPQIMVFCAVTSDLHRQNVIGVCSKNYLLKSGKASFVGIHTSPGLAPTDKLQ